MESITVKNFRCFGEEQTARLAPLTLLVGDNSTGKTSFLALIRALWDVAYRQAVPNFREQPYDLGSFNDIVYNAGVEDTESETFQAGFEREIDVPLEARQHNGTTSRITFHTVFDSRFGAPFPRRRRVENSDAWIDCLQREQSVVGFSDGSLTYEDLEVPNEPHFGTNLIPIGKVAFDAYDDATKAEWTPDVPDFGRFGVLFQGIAFGRSMQARPYASAPTRSRPSRTYDPSLITHAPEGDHTPTYLANMSLQKGDDWEKLQGRLTDFGRTSGLFDDFRVHHLGKTEGSPFQIHVRKRGKKRRGTFRNLVDMGYGVSQVLPVLTEMLRPDGPTMFLLQQPEVHLHPSAQAALGSLFCSMAAAGKQIIVETHSEYIVDRIRMDVRDGSSDLNPDDVSVLYFERSEQSVKIHSLSFGEDGELINAPPGYGRFFMDEVNRSIGI